MPATVRYFLLPSSYHIVIDSSFVSLVPNVADRWLSIVISKWNTGTTKAKRKHKNTKEYKK
jgi:hypothetical protein